MYTFTVAIWKPLEGNTLGFVTPLMCWTRPIAVSRASRLIFRHIFLCPPASITYWWHYRSIDSKEYWHGSQGEQGTKAFDPQGPQADEGSHPPERAAESGGDGLWTHALWSGGAGRQTPHGSAGEDGRHNRDASGRHAPR